LDFAPFCGLLKFDFAQIEANRLDELSGLIFGLHEIFLLE
jgi:hypothetical protein